MEITADTRLIRIVDGKKEYFGADQYWYHSYWQRESGCAPATAALMTMHLAAAFPLQCAALYPYALPPQKSDFVAHMVEIREFVKPGMTGLTDPHKFAEGVLAFAKRQEVAITAQHIAPILSNGVAFGFFKQALRHGYLPALLILRNPAKELADLTWHWMAVTGCDDETRTLTVSTYGKRIDIPFDSTWVRHKPYFSAGVYFYPV